MFYNGTVDTGLALLNELSAFSALEADGEPTTPACHVPQKPTKPASAVISSAVLPNGKTIPLVKTLLTSACERNCFYCPFRAGRDFRRATFIPDELAQTFMQIANAGIAQGIFLSSGIAGGGIRTQDKLLDTAAILRQKYQYRGYLHLKIMPGAERKQVLQAMLLADRVSINLEAPNPERLKSLAPRKNYFAELLQPLRWVEEIRRSLSPHQAWKGRWPSSVTQFVVGAVGESDHELLDTTRLLYKDLHLRRTYFSAFRPVIDTPLENKAPTHPLRQHRLYQAAFLLRDYGFDLADLPLDTQGNLVLQRDPKQAWAEMHLAHAPIELNTASRSELLRVPGIGPRSLQALLDARRSHRITSLDQLGHIGINTSRAAPYILLDGFKPPTQMAFW